MTGIHRFPETPGPWSRALAGLFCSGSRVYHAAYDRGLRRPRRLPIPVVSVGNLTVGGTGKTPVTALLIAEAERRGLTPCVLTRGYGGTARSSELLGGRVNGQPATAAEVGDEALLLSRQFPGVPVLVGARRGANAEAYLARGGSADVMILDDGFQHRALARDADLVLVDARRPWGNGFTLPAGPLREPASALARASVVLVTGFTGPGRRPIPDDIARIMGSRPVFTAVSAIRGFRPLHSGDDLPDSRGLRVRAVVGIARPERFRDALESVGVEVAAWSVYPDHHPFNREDVRREETAAAKAGHVLVTTAKDAVRLELLTGSGWLVADYGMSVDPDSGALWDALLSRGSGGQ